MYTPDRNIVRKVKEYDPDLYIQYNQKKEWFELWRKVTNTNVRLNQALEDQLITPITQSIYDPELPREFVQLDERILYWIYCSDSHRHGKNMYFEQDERFLEFKKKQAKKNYENNYDLGKDIYSDVNNFYYSDTKAKKTRPKFENYKEKEKKRFIRPDSYGRTSNRVAARTPGNARLYNYDGSRRGRR